MHAERRTNQPQRQRWAIGRRLGLNIRAYPLFRPAVTVLVLMTLACEEYLEAADLDVRVQGTLTWFDDARMPHVVNLQECAASNQDHPDFYSAGCGGSATEAVQPQQFRLECPEFSILIDYAAEGEVRNGTPEMDLSIFFKETDNSNTWCENESFLIPVSDNTSSFQYATPAYSVPWSIDIDDAPFSHKPPANVTTADSVCADLRGTFSVRKK